MATLPPTDPTEPIVCPVCDRLISPNESTGRSGSRVLHLGCWLSEREDARRAAAVQNKADARDLLIIARWQIGLYELMRRRAAPGAPDLEIRLDERQLERRRPPSGPMGDERRRRERREADLAEHLIRFGWAVVSAAERD